jgi:rubrerythrin
MGFRCDNCGSEYEGRWELDHIADARGNARKVCPACDDPQSTFTER